MESFFTKKEVQSTNIGKSNSCAICGLYGNSTTPRLKLQGQFKKQIMIVGESTNALDDERGILWEGKEGRLLKKTLEGHGIDVDVDCITINACCCFSDKPITTIQIDACRKNLLKAIQDYKPVLILALGIGAVQSLIGHRWKKKLDSIQRWRGLVIPDQEFKALICPIFSPQYVIDKFKNKEVEVIWNSDIARAVETLTKSLFPIYDTPEIEIITDLSILDSITSGVVSIDYETTGLKPHGAGHKIICVSVAISENHCYVFVMPKTPSERKPFINLLNNCAVKKMAHNMKFEEAWSFVRLKQSVTNWYWDSMIASHILDNRTGISGLKFQTYVNFGVVDYDSEIAPYLHTSDDSLGANGINRIEELIQSPEGLNQLLTYCGLDTIYQYRLARLQIIEINKRKLKDAYTLFHNGMLALARAEQQGIRIDTDYVEQTTDSISKDISKLEVSLFQSKFYKDWQRVSKGVPNINSNPQLSNYLYKILQIKPIKETKSGNYGATDEDALGQLNIPELNIILKIRQLKKLKDTYLGAYAKEQVKNYMHPFFNLHTVVTYRGSSDSPNFQNVPKRDKEAMKLVRTAIYPRPGNQLMEIDFSGIEVSIAACYHKDPVMIDYLVHDKDMHGDMAKQIFMIPNYDKNLSEHYLLRQAAKNGFVFPQFYGDYYKNNVQELLKWTKLSPTNKIKEGTGILLPGGESISTHLIRNKIKTITDFENHLKEIEYDFWNNRFKVYGTWKKKWVAEYRKTGYFRTFTNFILSGEMNQKHVINYPIQGTGFHCLLWSLIQTDKIMISDNWGTKIIGQVHDSIVLDVVPDELKIITKSIVDITTNKLAAHWDWLIVPMRVEADLGGIDEPWSCLKKYKI